MLTAAPPCRHQAMGAGGITPRNATHRPRTCFPDPWRVMEGSSLSGNNGA